MRKPFLNMKLIKRVDAQIIAIFIALNGLTYLFSYHFLLDHKGDIHIARSHATVIMYGSAQSFFGFISGYCVAKWWWWTYRTRKGDEDEEMGTEEETSFYHMRPVKKRKTYPEPDRMFTEHEPSSVEEKGPLLSPNSVSVTTFT